MQVWSGKDRKQAPTECGLFFSPLWLFLDFVSLLKPLLPAVLLGHRIASPNRELLTLPQVRRRGEGAAATPVGPRKIAPCLCSRNWGRHLTWSLLAGQFCTGEHQSGPHPGWNRECCCLKPHISMTGFASCSYHSHRKKASGSISPSKSHCECNCSNRNSV